MVIMYQAYTFIPLGVWIRTFIETFPFFLENDKYLGTLIRISRRNPSSLCTAKYLLPIYYF